MPFKSEAQRKLCYLLKNKGQAGSWDCSEWSAETGKKKLPEHVKKQEEKKALEAVAKLARCWAGYEPVPGKEPFSNDSCRPKAKSKKQEEKKGSNILVGGKGDNKKPSDFPKDVIDEAVNHEMEHTSNKDVAQEIAIDHLTEDVDYYKKLKKIEGNKEAAMHKLAKAWAAKAKISKLAEVATVPNRGAGDKQDTVIDTDPTEGLPKTNEIESASLPDKKPVNKRLRSAQARKALISATRKTFGTNPTGGSLFSKMSADFDFSGLNKKLDPSILGSSNNTSFSNPINQLGNTLKQVGSEMGNRVGGAVRQGVEGWVKAPGFSNPMEVYRRRNQALAAQKAFGDMGKGMGQAFSSVQQGASSLANQGMAAARGAGSSLMNMFGKAGEAPAVPQPQNQTGFKTPTISPGAMISGAGSALGNAFRAGFGNDASYQSLQQQANTPNIVQGAQDWKNSLSAMGQFAKDKAAPHLLKSYVSARSGLPANFGGDYVGNTAVKQLWPLLSPAAQSAASYAPFTKAISSVANPIVQGTTNYLASREAARRTAGYALPVVDFFRNNPWAAYALTAGGGLLGGALLGRMFGRGEDDQQQKEDNPVESAMAQGYKQQASRQMPANAYDPRSRYA